MKYIFIIIIQIVAITHIFAQQGSLTHNAINKIINYAKDQTNPKPTIKDYTDANVSGITSQNLKDVNQKIIKIQSGERDPAYNYLTDKDYIYDFNNTESEAITLTLKDYIIDLGINEINKNTTVLLKIAVNATKLGQYFTPVIKITYNGKSYTHALEPGAKGLRYLNLSSLHLNKNTRIKLEGKFVSLNNQTVTLIVFKNPQIQEKKILIIAPHPDDAEIAAYGLYSAMPNDTYIITVTAGDGGSDLKYKEVFYHSQRKRYYIKGKMRTIESITVPLLGGVTPEHCINLGFFNDGLGKMYQDKSSEVRGFFTKSTDINTFRQYNVSSLSKGLGGTTNWNSLVDNLAYLLNEIKPEIIISPYPALDMHPDHKYSSLALFEALKQIGKKEGKLFLYTNHANLSEYYPYGKTGDSVSLPPYNTSSIYFNSIYSHKVSLNIQNEKKFALEAMSDLRYEKNDSFFLDPCSGQIDLICKDYSYIRRSARSNELFFIIDIENIYDDAILDKLL